MKNQLEQRRAVEVRTEGRKLTGYAAVFGTEAQIADFVEVIRPGAFKQSLAAGKDILALVDHDHTRLLGRTKTGTLNLSEDSRGLQFILDIPDTQAGRDVLALAERGDLGGMSFGFKVNQGGESWQGNLRELSDLDLREISVVSAWPAYEGTTVTARAKTPPRLARAMHYMETLKWGY